MAFQWHHDPCITPERRLKPRNHRTGGMGLRSPPVYNYYWQLVAQSGRHVVFSSHMARMWSGRSLGCQRLVAIVNSMPLNLKNPIASSGIVGGHTCRFADLQVLRACR